MGTWQFWVVIALLVVPLILLYYTIDRKRIFGIFFFGYKEYLGLLEFRKGMNQFYIFLIDVAIAYLAYWLTKIVLKLRKET
jgi:hypothetical protein